MTERQNMMCSNHKANSQAYRDNYDANFRHKDSACVGCPLEKDRPICLTDCERWPGDGVKSCKTCEYGVEPPIDSPCEECMRQSNWKKRTW